MLVVLECDVLLATEAECCARRVDNSRVSRLTCTVDQFNCSSHECTAVYEPLLLAPSRAPSVARQQSKVSGVVLVFHRWSL